MKKNLLAAILLVSSFTSSNLMGFGDFSISTHQNARSTKSHSGFKVLKKHGTLFFQFTTIDAPTGFSKGKWQACIVTPDKKTFKGPVINVKDPATTFTIKVKHPILFGTYRIVVKNISVTNFLGSLTKDFVTVSNSFNSEMVDAAITPLFDTSFNVPNDPGLILEGEFTPFHPFIPH